MARARSAMDASLGESGGASEILSFPTDQDDRRQHGPDVHATLPPSPGDWQAAVTDVLARLDASEQRTLLTLDRLRQRVDRLEADLAGLCGGKDNRVLALERQIVVLGERLHLLEDRAISRTRRR